MTGRRLRASAFVLTELPRAVRARVPADDGTTAAALLRRLDLVDLDRGLLREAGALPGPLLRSLDAIHLASALRIRDAVEVFVAYDTRLLEAAEGAGLDVASPA